MPAAGAQGVGLFGQLAPDLDADEQRVAVGGRAFDQEVRLRRPQLHLQGAPGAGVDARDVGDVEQVRLQRVDVLANAHAPCSSELPQHRGGHRRHLRPGQRGVDDVARVPDRPRQHLGRLSRRTSSARQRSCGWRRCRRRRRRARRAPRRRRRPPAPPPAPPPASRRPPPRSLSVRPRTRRTTSMPTAVAGNLTDDVARDAGELARLAQHAVAIGRDRVNDDGARHERAYVPQQRRWLRGPANGHAARRRLCDAGADLLRVGAVDETSHDCRTKVPRPPRSASSVGFAASVIAGVRRRSRPFYPGD